MIKRLGTFIIVLFLISAAPTGCARQNPEDIAADFTDMLDSAATVEDVYEAESFLLDMTKALSEEQVGELLLHWEDRALKIDNTSVDYSDIISSFEASIPDYLRELFEFKDIEQKNPVISGAAILVPWDELLDRTTKLESYIVDNVDHTLIKDDTMWLYKRYLSALLIGASNTPVFDYITSEFSGELRFRFDEYQTNHPDTYTSVILTEYKSYLESIGYSLNYDNKNESAVFFETCSRLISEAEKQVSVLGKGSS